MHATAGDQARDRATQLRHELTEEVTAEVRADLRKSARRRALLRCGGCCVGELVVVLGTATLLAFLVARTGLVEVPFFRGVTRDRPPVRIVRPTALASPAVLLATKLAPFGRRPAAGMIAVTITEADLTALLRWALAETGVAARVRETAQVLAFRDALEVTARLHGIGAAETTVRIAVVPTVHDGVLAREVRSASVGALGIPRVVARLLLKPFLDRLPTLRIPATTHAPTLTVDRVTAREGAVVLDVRVGE